MPILAKIFCKQKLTVLYTNISLQNFSSQNESDRFDEHKCFKKKSRNFKSFNKQTDQQRNKYKIVKSEQKYEFSRNILRNV